MDKKAALKKEEEKKNLQLSILQQQILQALYSYAFFKFQQRLMHQKKIKKNKHLIYRRKRLKLKKQHLLHLHYECYALLKEPRAKVELLVQHGLFAKKVTFESEYLSPHFSIR